MAITFVNSADLTDNNGSSNSQTSSYTIGGGSNRLLVLCIEGDVCSNPATDPTVVTYGGTTMLKAVRNDNGGDSTSRYDYIYYLLEASLPAAGAHNFIVTFGGTQLIILTCAEYNGVSALDNTATNGVHPDNATSLSSSITTVANNCWVVLMEQHDGTGQTTVAGTGVTLRKENVHFNQPAILDSNAAVTPAGTYNVSTSVSGVTLNSISHTLASFTPVGTTFIPRSQRLRTYTLPVILNR